MMRRGRILVTALLFAGVQFVPRAHTHHAVAPAVDPGGDGRSDRVSHRDANHDAPACSICLIAQGLHVVDDILPMVVIGVGLDLALTPDIFKPSSGTFTPFPDSRGPPTRI